MPPQTIFALCADDFALSPGVTEGILEALAAGRLTATCAMTTQEGWPEAARAFRELAPDADLGLHFNLTLGAPLAEMPRFAPGGAFLDEHHRPRRLARRPAARGNSRRISPPARLLRGRPARPPDFVDGHQHVHVLPGIADDLLAELSARGLAGKCWLRDSADRPSAFLRAARHWGKALTVAGLARGFRAKARAAGFATNDGFAGFSDFDAKADYGADFATYLAAPGERQLVMCHPGHVDEELARLDPVTLSREPELAFLLSPSFLEIAAAAGARLKRWSASP